MIEYEETTILHMFSPMRTMTKQRKLAENRAGKVTEHLINSRSDTWIANPLDGYGRVEPDAVRRCSERSAWTVHLTSHRNSILGSILRFIHHFAVHDEVDKHKYMSGAYISMQTAALLISFGTPLMRSTELNCKQKCVFWESIPRGIRSRMKTNWTAKCVNIYTFRSFVCISIELNEKLVRCRMRRSGEKRLTDEMYNGRRQNLEK